MNTCIWYRAKRQPDYTKCRFCRHKTTTAIRNGFGVASFELNTVQGSHCARRTDDRRSVPACSDESWKKTLVATEDITYLAGVMITTLWITAIKWCRIVQWALDGSSATVVNFFRHIHIRVHPCNLQQISVYYHHWNKWGTKDLQECKFVGLLYMLVALCNWFDYRIST